MFIRRDKRIAFIECRIDFGSEFLWFGVSPIYQARAENMLIACGFATGCEVDGAVARDGSAPIPVVVGIDWRRERLRLSPSTSFTLYRPNTQHSRICFRRRAHGGEV